jgi:hypothetical protein
MPEKASAPQPSMAKIADQLGHSLNVSQNVYTVAVRKQASGGQLATENAVGVTNGAQTEKYLKSKL